MFFGKEKRKQIRNSSIFNKIDVPENGKILDVSHGDGTLLRMIRNTYPDVELSGVDLQLPKNLDLTNIEFQIASANNLPFPNDNFDVIICSMALHHYDKSLESLQEIFRKLTDKGTLYLMDISPSNKFSLFLYNLIKCHEPYHFEKFYSVDEIKCLTKKVGFRLANTQEVSKIPKIKIYTLNK